MIDFLANAYEVMADAAALYVVYILLLAAGEGLKLIKHSKLLDAVVLSTLMIVAVYQDVPLKSGFHIDLHGALIAVAVLILGARRSLFPMLAGVITEVYVNWASGAPSGLGIVLGYGTVVGLVRIFERGPATDRRVLWLFLSASFLAAVADALPMLIFQRAGFLDVAESVFFELIGALIIGGLAWVTRSRNTAFVKNAQMVDDLKQRIKDTAAALGSAMLHRDPVTASHQDRVAHLAHAIGVKLALDQNTLDALDLAGLVHDIGQIEVPSEILSRPGPLSAHEVDLVRLHPEIGHTILQPIKFEGPVAEIIYQHHENLDGSGYPRGLKGDDILMGARIMRVCDIVDAMTSARPFRLAYSVDAALAQITAMRGAKLDARVVDACVSLYRDEGYHPPKSRGL